MKKKKPVGRKTNHGKHKTIQEQVDLLDAAAARGNLRRMRELIEKGADVDGWQSVTGFRPIISAAANGHRKAVELLLSAGAGIDLTVWDDGYPTDHSDATALMLASLNGHGDIVNLLLKRGADLNINAKHPGTPTAIEYAAEKDRYQIARRLLKAGAALTHQAVNRAIKYGHLATLKELLKGRRAKEIPFNASSIVVAVPATSTRTRTRQHLEVLKRILAAGADINGEDSSGDTALRRAIRSSNPQLLKFLIEAGARVNHLTRNASTALHYAAFLGRGECARILVAAGAELNIKNGEGKTPIQWAKFHDQKEMVKLLEEVQAARALNQRTR